MSPRENKIYLPDNDDIILRNIKRYLEFNFRGKRLEPSVVVRCDTTQSLNKFIMK